MPCYLLVANETLGGEDLLGAVKQRIAKGPCHFHVLVPSPGPTTLYDSVMGACQGVVPGDDDSVNEAGRRLGCEVAWLHNAGADVDGEIGDADPIEAIRRALVREPFDEIILSTLPAGLSRWIGADLPHRVERHFHLPVCLIQGTPQRRHQDVPNS